MNQTKPFNILRARAHKARPYFGYALHSIHPVEVKGLEKMTGDLYWRVYFDPDWLQEQVDKNLSETTWKFIHLMSHMIRRHGNRAQRAFVFKREEKKWELSADLEINDDIMDIADIAGHGKLKEPAQTPKANSFDLENNATAEEYYSQLPDEPGAEGDEGEGQGDDTQSPGDGSCATGLPKDYEQGKPDENNTPGTSEQRADLISRQVAKELKQHIKQRGTVPGGWEKWADGIIDPQIPWWRIFATRLRQSIAYVSGLVDYTYSRPSRRQIKGMVLPSLRRPKFKIGVIIDTSGSMDSKDMAKALGAVKSVLKLCVQDGVTILAADSDVHSCQQVFSVDKVQLLGDGGTDMRVPIAFMDNLPKNKRPDICVMITDGYSPFPKEAPRGMTFVTLLTNNGDAPPFGTVLYCKGDVSNDDGDYSHG